MADNNNRELSSAELEALMISELPTQATANETDLFEVAIVDANSASGYASKKESAAAIADAIIGEYQYPLRITGTTAKTIAGAINELKNLVDLLPQFAIEVVNTLPVSDISETTIYLVPASDPEQGNYYEEYIYVNNAWELVGTTAVDLSGYYTSAQVDTLLAAKANTSSLATVATSGAYSDLSGKPTIDTALDTTSTNAVENRAVAGEINSIKSDITVEGSASGDIASFVDGSDNPLKELKISIEAVQSGSGDPSPTNVRPISGFNAVNVGDISDTEKVQYFKGLLDGTYGFVKFDGTQSFSNKTGTENLFSYTDATIKNNSSTATLSNVISSYLPTRRQDVLTTNKTLEGVAAFTWGTQIVVRITGITSAADLQTYFVSHPLYVIYELATPTTPTITSTEFNTLVSAFGLQGWFVHIDWQSTAGTVYGGTLDVKNGILTVTQLGIDISTLPWKKDTLASNKWAFYINGISGAYVQSDHTKLAKFICSKYKVVSSQSNSQLYNIDYAIFQKTNGQIFITDSTYTTYEDFIEHSSGVILVYELATPVTYQLTPTEIRSLLGINNVWADCGSITELKYTRDLNLCINDIIARIEALEGGSNTRSLSVSPVLTKSIVSDSDTAEGKTEEETEEETKEEAQNER